MEVREVSIDCDDATRLIAMLDEELGQEYPPEHMHPVDVASFHPGGGVFFVAYEDATPVACAGLRPLSDKEVELKRMFVLQTHRRRGVARQVLNALETKARQLGYTRMLLETGDKQAAALSLYVAAGYYRIESYGEYAAGPRSRCFAKDLAPSSIGP